MQTQQNWPSDHNLAIIDAKGAAFPKSSEGGECLHLEYPLREEKEEGMHFGSIIRKLFYLLSQVTSQALVTMGLWKLPLKSLISLGSIQISLSP